MEPKTADFRRRALRGAISFLFLALVGFLQPAAIAQDSGSKGKTIIVLDASGSMWGEVPGGVKIDVAKETVARLVPSINPGIELGLMAYGHRKKGDCSDIELLVPPAMDNREAILTRTRNLIPIGKTPLCDAVMLAADALKYEENKATVILVSDGIETCGKDPATVGDLLAAKGIDFVCHVVAFDIEKDKNAGLDALSSKTGGLYLEAKDADGLYEALNEAVQAAVRPETALILSARNGAGELLDGVNFEIYSGKASEEPSHRGTGGKFRTPLEAGDYQIVAKFGEASAEGSIKVPGEETTSYELTFEATGLTVRGALTKDGSDLEDGLSWKIYTEPPSTTERQSIANSYEAAATFQLAPGIYFLAGRYEESRAEVEVEIVEGKASDVKVIFGSGRLISQAKMSEDSDVITADMSWKLFPAKADSEGDRKVVAFNYDPKSEMVVPAGKYLLRAAHKESATQKEVEVKAGENTEVILTFGAGTVITHARMAEGMALAEGDLGWKLLGPPNEEGKRRQVAVGYSDSESFKVPSGVYLLQLKRGSAAAEQEVVVSAGATEEVTLTLNAGIWSGEAFMAEDSKEPVTDDTGWKIFSQPNAEGKRKQVTVSYNEATYYLTAGTYLARLTRGAASVEKEISISPGEKKKDRFVLNAGIVVLKGNENHEGSKIRVVPADPEKTKQVALAYNHEVRAYLPAGDYVATYDHKVNGEVQSSDTAFTVEAGKMLEVSLQ
ncbi:MAG: VWA domain-containing protein [Verrucomicrobiales bacterium]|nr:VWA domain-containing protein [Verrucomicrobiales bacterium]